VKIGYTKDVASRLADLQLGNPHNVTLLGVIEDATPSLERTLHKKFASDHHKGEWFRLTGDISKYIEAHCTKDGLPVLKRNRVPGRQQMNLKVSRDFHNRFCAMAREHGMSQRAFAEHVINWGIERGAL
jgi:predicted HicB family RNase H-like nuclease